MKPALELLDDIVEYVKPRQGCAISLREKAADSSAQSNWIEGADPSLRPDELARLIAASELLHRKHPQIDWAGIPAVGQWRQIARSANGSSDTWDEQTSGEQARCHGGTPAK
jgi:hypothetical protein